MRYFKQKIVLCLALLINLSLQAQATLQDPGYISYKDKLEFNLPQLGVSLQLPPMMGFKVPIFKGDNLDMNISQQTYYCYDLKYLKNPKTRIFSFAMTKEEKNPLRMDITEYPPELSKFVANNANGDINIFVETLYYKDEQFIKHIKSKLGTSVSSIIRHNNRNFEIHRFYVNGYCFQFYFEEGLTTSTRKKYENIIKSFNKKDLSQQKYLYERRVKLGYYNPDKKKETESDTQGKLQRFEGKTSENTTFICDFSGISINIPEGWKYEVDARKVTERAGNIKEIWLNNIDLYNKKTLFSLFLGKKFNVIARLCDKESMNVVEYIDQNTKNASYTKSGSILIDGIPATIVYCGSESDGSIDLYFNISKGTVWCSVYGYSLETSQEVAAILEKIKVDDSAIERQKNKKQPSLASLFQLKEIIPAKLDQIILPQIKADNSCRMTISNIGLNLSLKGKLNDYNTIKNKKTVPIANNGILTNKLSQEESISILHTTSNMLVVIEKTDTSEDQEATLSKMKQSWSNHYKNISNIKAGILNFNNLEWGLFLYKREKVYTGTATTYYNGYKIELDVMQASNEQEVLEELAYIKTFKFE